MAPPQVQALSEHKVSPQGSSPSPDLDPMAVLAVVSTAVERCRLRQYFASAPPNYHLVEADTWTQALGLWRGDGADWVLIDLDGLGARALEYLVVLGDGRLHGPLPVVVLVGPGQERIALEAMKLGAADYLFKADLTPDTLWVSLRQGQQAVHKRLTAQRQTTAALEKSRGHYQNLVENSPDAIERFDLDLRHIYVSPVLSTITGLEVEAFLGKTCRELGLDEAMVKAWEAAAARAVATGEKQAIEFTTPTLAGLRRFEMAIAPEWSDLGQIESLLCISRDISDRVAAQQAQQRLLAEAQTAQRSATQAQARLSNVLDRMHDGIIAFDSESRCVYLNRSAEQTLGRTLGRTLGDLMEKPIWAEFPKAIATPLYAAYQRAIEHQQTEVLDYYVSPLDRWFEVRFYPDDQGITVYFTDISDRHAAAANRQQTDHLRHELNLLEHILDSVLAGYWDFDFEHHQAYYSPGLKALLGYTDDELPNHLDTWQQIIFPEDRPKVLASLDRHIQSRGAVHHSVEVRHRHKNGSTVWVLWAGQVIDWDDAGQPKRMVGCHVDITQLKQAETRLRKSEAHLQAAQRIGHLGSWEFDVATGHIVWSDQVYCIFGLTVGSCPASFEVLQGYFHPDDRDRHRQIVETTIATHHPYDEEFRIVRADGSLGYIHVKGEAAVGSTGQLTHLTGTAQDISERKQHEVEVQRLSLRLALALKSGRIGSWERVLNTDEVIWDQCLVDLYGFDRLGRSATYQDWRAHVYSADLARIDLAHQALMTNDTLYDLELRVWRGDGSLGWIRSSALVQRDAQGEPLSVIGINYDITDRKQAEQQIVRTASQLAASNHELEAFAYSVSHDLRAPLRAIDGFSRALLEDYGDQFDEAAQDYFDRIRHNVERMGHLIDDLLRLSKVSRSAMVYVPVDLSALVQAQIDEVKAAAPDRLVTIAITPSLTVNADPTLMGVVVANLVQNAWKFTAHHATAHLEFSLSMTEDGPVYYLRDDGAGFDMAYADKLFGVFQRLHNTHEFPGTGIGLATVQRAIHRHGGQVWAEAAVEQGATVYFTLPGGDDPQEAQP